MIEIGLKHTSELTVTDTVTAIKMGSGDMPVLATPAMMALMERSSSARLLPEGRKNLDSPKPTVRSIITAHYTGKTIDGKQFDSSRGGVPLACRLCDLIEGWIIAIQQMHIGDKWELYIPAEMGYGKFSQPGIPGGSTLIFEIELLGIS